MIFETHAHYDDDRFKDDRDEIIKRVHEKGPHKNSAAQAFSGLRGVLSAGA